MKFLKSTFPLILCLIIVTSCSNESTDQDNGSSTTNPTGNYFPSTVNDYWNYDVESTNNDTSETLMSTDSLYVTTQNANDFTLGVNNDMVANGTTNNLLTSGSITRTETTLSLNGTLALPQELVDLIDFEITLDNVVLYDVNAADGTELSSTTNTVTQDFNGFPITITYNLRTVAQGFQETLNSNGQNYSDVTTANLILNLSVSTSVPVGPINFDIDILEPQDVLVSTNRFAKDIGLIHAETNTTYQISSAAITALEAQGIPLNIPESGSITNIQILTDYMVTE